MALQDTLAELVTGLTIETAWTPPLSIADPLKPGPPSPIMRALKPKVTVTLQGASQPMVFAPYGDPGPSRWPLIKVALIVLGAAGVGYLVSRRRRR